MPATFESFGIKFLYPDNWTVAQRAEDEGDNGMTLDMPSGGFFAIEVENEGLDDDEVIAKIADTIKAEYNEVEVEDVTLEGASRGERAAEMRFYYLDLLIVSRVVLLKATGETLVVQIQAESRDFDENELVFAAILQQIRPA
ncbi:MAG: hypothetical protein HKN47_10765 [Pirellulaceae bacterium]|nr:hypothetical protein [Pirellulaceae bacterium]